MLRVTLCAALGLLSLMAPARSQASGCAGSLGIQHSRAGAPEGGAIDFTGTGYAGKGKPGPAMRFWAYGHFKEANGGDQPQVWDSGAWLMNPAVDYKAPGVAPSRFVLHRADWYGMKVTGCPLSFPEPRTVVEISFPDPVREGSKEHQGFYVILSMPLDQRRGMFDASAVRGGEGERKNVVPLAPIPAPKVLEVKAAAGHLRLKVELPPAVSYSEGGKDAPVRLVKGYRVLYARGAEPKTSDPAAYLPVHDPGDPARELGVVPPGVVQVDVPAEKEVWLVSRLVYDDPAALESAATSSHVAAAAVKPGGSGRARGKAAERSRGE